MCTGGPEGKEGRYTHGDEADGRMVEEGSKGQEGGNDERKEMRGREVVRAAPHTVRIMSCNLPPFSCRPVLPHYQEVTDGERQRPLVTGDITPFACSASGRHPLPPPQLSQSHAAS